MDWIKVELCLPHKPEVIRIGRTLKISPEAVCGWLIKFWGWVGANSVDGVVEGVVEDDIDMVLAFEGFAKALKQVKWIEVDSNTNCIRVPNFQRHNGESAKKRALGTKYQSKWREKAKARVEVPVDVPRSTKGLPEKRREDITTKAVEPDPNFAVFWDAYPKKVAKPHALKSWSKLKPDSLLAQRIISAVECFPWNPDPSYIPYPSTWLNQRRWEDESPDRPNGKARVAL